MTPFSRTPDGRVVAQFTALETELISDMASQVSDLLDENVTLSSDRLLASVGIGGSDALSDDPAVARLLPNGYADDDEAAVEFRHLTEHGLAERKISNARLVVTGLLTASGAEFALDDEAQQAWLRTLNDIRLVIAARLGIETDDDHGRVDSEEAIVMREVYDWLAMVQDSLIEVLDS